MRSRLLNIEAKRPFLSFEKFEDGHLSWCSKSDQFGKVRCSPTSSSLDFQGGIEEQNQLVLKKKFAKRFKKSDLIRSISIVEEFQ